MNNIYYIYVMYEHKKFGRCEDEFIVKAATNEEAEEKVVARLTSDPRIIKDGVEIIEWCLVENDCYMIGE